MKMKRNKKKRKKEENSLNMYLSIITLNVNGLNAPIKRQRVVEWVIKQDLYIYPASKRPTSDQKIHTD